MVCNIIVENKEKEDYNSIDKWRVVKNVIVIGVAFMVHFTAFSGAANLQSSINSEAGLGTASLAAVYAGFIFSSIFLSSAVIKWLGTKWAICFSFMTYMPYIGVQLWPRFYTMIPAAILVGLGAGPLWCAKCIYITVISEAYSKISKMSTEVLLPRLFGLFFTILQCNAIWGNLVSSLVLSSGGNKAAVTSMNASLIPELCGANFLPSADAGKALQEQPPEKIQMLTGIFLACMAAAVVIVALGADSMKRYDKRRPTAGLSGFALLSVTLKLLSEPNQLLLVTLNVFVGFQHAFFSSDVTVAFVSCSVGTGTVGYFMMAHGIADIVGIVSTSLIAALTGRIPLMVGAASVQVALLTTMIAWTPHPDSVYVLYIIAVLWGLCNSVWLVQVNAYCGILFPGREEAAFSNFRLWDSVGFIISYLISPYFRTSTKTYFQIVLLVIGILCYFVTEYRERVRKMTVRGSEGCDNMAFKEVE